MGKELAAVRRELVRLNGMDLLCLVAGEGPETMLCLHGMYGRAEDWVDLMARHAGRFRVIAFDQRGHGLSSRPLARYGGEEMADDAVAVLEHYGAGPALVVGHSMGGRNAFFLAARRPDLVRALAILDIGAGGSPQPSDCPPDAVPECDGLTADWPLPFPSRQHAIAFLEKKMATQVAVDYFAASLFETAAGWDFRFSRRAMAALGVYWRNWEDIPPRVACPILFLRAAESWCLTPEGATTMRRLAPHAEYVEIPGSDHNLHHDNQAAFNEAFDRFLAAL
jgi:2-succinyl-6-hydroxy-2,4-cyclohexadiene-1-carboxylate synthase